MPYDLAKDTEVLIIGFFFRNPLKRKEAPGSQHTTPPPQHVVQPGANLHQGEYDNGRVICEVCGGGVSFRDEESGVFTLKHWDTHRLTWYLIPCA